MNGGKIMTNNEAEKLLTDRRVVEEINRHLWLESEKAGYDIGFEKAKEDWLKRFSKAWMEYHMSKESKKTPEKKNNTVKSTRRAKSYITE